MNETIVSLTSHGIRLNYVYKTIFSICNQCNLKIVLTLFKDDAIKIPNGLQLLANSGIVEILVADQDLGPHLKYYYAMKKYKNCNVITIDDDCIYARDFISSLLDYHSRFPTSVIARRAHLIGINNNHILPYRQWRHCIKQSTDYRHVFPTGVGGVLYPANVLDIDNIDLNELKKCLYQDDIYLKILENRKKIPIQIVNCQELHPMTHDTMLCLQTGLHINNTIKNQNDEVMKLFEKDLI